MISAQFVQSFGSFVLSLPFQELVTGEVLKYIVVGNRRNSCNITGETLILSDPQAFSKKQRCIRVEILLKSLKMRGCSCR